ncbi:MAG: hypothetical protein RL685_6502 [Pseudomonadota bacterium]|jgi:hypothetical protein
MTRRPITRAALDRYAELCNVRCQGIATLVGESTRRASGLDAGGGAEES